MMRYGLSLTSPLVFLLLACGGGGGGGSACTGDCSPIETGPCKNPIQLNYFPPPVTQIAEIRDVDVVINVAWAPVELQIYGAGVLCGLNVEGSNNLIRFQSAEISVEECFITGNDNVIERPSSMELTCDDKGLGNSLFVY